MNFCLIGCNLLLQVLFVVGLVRSGGGIVGEGFERPLGIYA